MHLNILHRTATGPLYPVYRMQQDMVHEARLKVTLFLHYSDLFDEQVMADARSDHARFGDEIGLALHKFNGPGVETGGCGQFWLLPEDRKRSVLEAVLGKWREVFATDPVSIASYHLDAGSMRLIRELAPGTETVVGGCFEEGVRVFHGCNHSWYLFNEGMPWGPWYPARDHALRPAADAEDAVGLVAVPHLVRDMSLSYEGRNDFWASHPPNVIRGMGNEATWCPYDLNLIDQFRLQKRYNRHPAYLNTFVSASWLTWNHNSEYPPEVAQTLYRNQLAYFTQLRDEGKLEDLTLGEYGKWFRKNRTAGESELYWAKELLYGSRKHYLWYLDPHARFLIDCAQGGSIGDLRPYAGKIPMETGPEAPRKAIGSYPYLIQSQHRTGFPNHCHDGSRTTAMVTCNGHTVDLCSHKLRCRSTRRGPEGTTFILEEADLDFGDGIRARFETTYHFPGNGSLRMQRKLTSDCDHTFTVTEYIKACWGFTEYPEPLEEVSLHLGKQSLEYAYRGRVLEGASSSLRADIPPLRTSLELSAGDGPEPVSARASEGHLFNPYFTLELIYRIKPGNPLSTWIHLKAID